MRPSPQHNSKSAILWQRLRTLVASLGWHKGVHSSCHSFLLSALKAFTPSQRSNVSFRVFLTAWSADAIFLWTWQVQRLWREGSLATFEKAIHSQADMVLSHPNGDELHFERVPIAIVPVAA
eukprot:3117236-Amphidinium_carterae.1